MLKLSRNCRLFLFVVFTPYDYPMNHHPTTTFGEVAHSSPPEPRNCPVPTVRLDRLLRSTGLTLSPSLRVVAQTFLRVVPFVAKLRLRPSSSVFPPAARSFQHTIRRRPSAGMTGPEEGLLALFDAHETFMPLNLVRPSTQKCILSVEIPTPSTSTSTVV